MTQGVFQIPKAQNEPVLDYAPGTPERASLQAALEATAREEVEVPLFIGGEEVRTGRTAEIVMPHDHGHVLGIYHQAGPDEVAAAIDAAEAARADWAALPWQERAAVFLRAADLLASSWRDRVNAATMLNQSKTCHQAEIDAACELIDFWRFNPCFLEEMCESQPISTADCRNSVEQRPLDGFVFAITPFNFTSIAGNLPTAPALLGNTALWKPASTSVLSNWRVMQLLVEAGLPAGVVNFVPGPGATVGDPVLADSRLAGIHFTGSTAVFRSIWNTVGTNIANYGQYPRIVGETGGKNFVFADPSADVRSLVIGLLRGAFEYQGQKCSAASRAYIPKSLWPEVREQLTEEIGQISMGDVRDFSNFMGALIDANSYAKLSGAIQLAKDSPEVELVIGGECDDSKGWFVSPTVATVSDPRHELMRTEFFGPLLSVYVYEDHDVEDTIELCATGSDYALTGAVFADDPAAMARANDALRYAAGNFYRNDKPTGAVVGQQPFGGSRASGTNDKAGSIINLHRWSSQRTVKETLVPATDWRYPFLEKD